MYQEASASGVTLGVWQIKQQKNRVRIIVLAHANTLTNATVL